VPDASHWYTATDNQQETNSFSPTKMTTHLLKRQQAQDEIHSLINNLPESDIPEIRRRYCNAIDDINESAAQKNDSTAKKSTK
jgi:hypothetical protein